MSTLGAIHTALAVAAFALGGVIYANRKGGRYHRRLGYGFVAAMVGANGTALVMPAVTYAVAGRFGPFHVLAAVSLATTLAGLVPAYRRRPAVQWLDNHYTLMGWAYVGLVAATVAEAAVRLPFVRGFGPAFWAAAGVASFLVCFFGMYSVYRFRGRTIERVTTGYRTKDAPRDSAGE